MDAIKITRPTPAQIRQLITDWTNVYAPSEWIVERNAFQSGQLEFKKIWELERKMRYIQSGEM